jgi:FKBP-type peptidyl-prolyl cis-trans isomerase (trigger factor)
MDTSLNHLDNGNIEIRLSVPWNQIQAGFEAEVEEAVANAEISGFRKGKAPRSMVEPNLDRNHLFSHVIQKILPDIYNQAVKQLDIKPILYPQIHIEKGEEGKDWEFIAVTCEIPNVTMPENFEKEVAGVTKDPADTRLARILDYLRSTSQISVPEVLVQEETNHRISSLVENLTKLGVDTQTYLQSKKLTPETFKAQIYEEAKTDLVIEFILEKIRQTKNLADRRKTLDFLLELV